MLDGIIMLNFIYMILSSIITLIITYYIQRRNDRRKDKFLIFAALMQNRIHKNTMGWDEYDVKLLNSIDIVFSDESRVLDIWHEYLRLCSIPSPSEAEIISRDQNFNILLKEMAKKLGYKNIDLKSIENPYIPNSLCEIWKYQKQTMQQQANMTTLSQKNIKENQLNAVVYENDKSDNHQ